MKLKLISNLTNNSITKNRIENQFSIFFSSKQKKFLLVFINSFSIQNIFFELFDIFSHQSIFRMNKIHNKRIISIRTYKINNKNILITNSYDNSIKTFDIENGIHLFTITKAHDCDDLNYFFVSSCCFFKYLNENVLISACWNDNYLKMWNFDKKGEFIKKFCECKNIWLIDYFNNKNNKNFDKNFNNFSNENKNFSNDFNNEFIIVCGNLYIRSFYLNGELFKEYDSKFNSSFIIENNKNLIVSCFEFIKIFNFFSGELLNEIYCGIDLCGICMYKKFIICGGYDFNIHLFDYEKKIYLEKIIEHLNVVTTVKIIYFNNNYYLISHSKEGLIKLWLINE